MAEGRRMGYRPERPATEVINLTLLEVNTKDGPERPATGAAARECEAGIQPANTKVITEVLLFNTHY